VAAILVHIDLDGDRAHASSLIALAAGRQVASAWGATLYAVVIVHDPSEHAADSTAQLAEASTLPGMRSLEAELGRAGADKIVIALSDAPIAPLWGSVAGAWQAVIDKLRPRVVLFGADGPSALELATRTAARIGARLLVRAHASGIDDVELRDRDGGYARAADTGATVALMARAAAAAPADDDIDLLVLALPGGADSSIELAGTSPSDVSYTSGVVIALGEDVANDPQVAANAGRLAGLLGAQLIIPPAAPPVSSELCITIGTTRVDISGATSIVRIGAPAGRDCDGTLPAPAAAALIELVQRLESA
jgi:electron transfer flavoprotein alpha subunit